MHVTQLYTGSPLRNFNYLIRHGDAAVCIDPFDGDEMAAYLRTEGLTLSAIINTHHHHDHTLGNAALAAATGAPIWCHKDAAIAGAKAQLSHGQKITLGPANSAGEAKADESYIEVLDTPGHTMSHVALLVVDEGKPTALVAGDCIFNGGVGNCHNGGNPDVLYETVRDIILTLPDNVIIYPGHDYLANNLSFSLSIDAELEEARQLLAQYPQNDSRFIEANMALEKRISLFFRTGEERVQQLVGAASAGASAEDRSRATFLKLRDMRNRW